MSRPDFPKPYTPLTPGMISRIRSDQAYYDENPEQAERDKAVTEERRRHDEQESWRQEQEQEEAWRREQEEDCQPSE